MACQSNFTGYYHVCTRENRPRFYIESSRLRRFGFDSGAHFSVQHDGPALRVSLSDRVTRNRVTHRSNVRSGPRPLVTFCSQDVLRKFTPGEEIKVLGSWRNLIVQPTVRTFAIRRAREVEPPFRVLELYCGGGTLSDVVSADPRFRVVAGHEGDPSYADVWEAKHPDAHLFLGNTELADPSDYPPFDVLFAGIPCTEFSPAARGLKKKLHGEPEMGPAGALFIQFIELVAARMPLACVIENVPQFMTALAGRLVVRQLEKLGYAVSVTHLRPHEEWNQISDRKRIVICATLRGRFEPTSPGIRFDGRLDQFLDREDPIADAAAAEHVRVRVNYMKGHATRKQAQDSRNNFGIAVVDRDAAKIHTLKRNYWQANYGPFLRTPQGERLFRLNEVEAIMGSKAGTSHYTLGIEVLGQGVQGEIFRRIVRELGDFLCGKPAETTGQLELSL